MTETGRQQLTPLPERPEREHERLGALEVAQKHRNQARVPLTPPILLGEHDVPGEAGEYDFRFSGAN